MADNGAVPDQNEKIPIDQDPEIGVGDHELDDSKAKFINGGNDTTVVVPSSPSSSKPVFTGLGKDELKKYAEDPFWVRLRWILFILFWVGWLAMLVSAIVIIVLAPRCPTRPDLRWYHTDASYNVYGKSFFDGSKQQDGYGDLEGIKQKQGYVEQLGSNSIWLSGVLKTSPADNDRAVVDHKMLAETFGTVEALKDFCKTLMKKSKRVIMDLVPNQTSKNHTWFIASQKKEGKYADYYIWTDNPNNWKRQDGQTSMWVMDPVRNQYYLSHFDDLPDLNLTNPDVIDEFGGIIHFWAGAGISGFHINDMEVLAENSSLADEGKAGEATVNFEDNAVVIDSLKEIVDGLDNKPGREKLLFGTVTQADSDDIRMYAGQDGKRGLHMVSVVIDQLSGGKTAAELEEGLKPYINVSQSHWLAWRLTTPVSGSERVSNRVGADRMMAAHALQALLPGSSLPYYGDEIAMENGIDAMKRTVTPMQWTKEKNAGFTSGTPWLAVNNGYETKNLDSMTAQLGDSKLVDSFTALSSLRSSESLQFGKTMFCTEGDLLIFARRAEGFESFVVVVNLGQETAHKFLGSECVGGRDSAELVFHSHNAAHASTKLDLKEAISIGAYEVLVLKFPA